MSAIDYYPARETVYKVGDRRIRRNEILGREGGKPPICILWFDFDTGEWLGSYDFDGVERVARGPMFA